MVADTDIFILGCTGTEFSADGSSALKTGICEGGDLLVEDQNVGSSLSDFQCKRQPDNEATVIGSCGPDGGATLIQINFDVLTSQEGGGCHHHRLPGHQARRLPCAGSSALAPPRRSATASAPHAGACSGGRSSLRLAAAPARRAPSTASGGHARG